MTGLEYACLDDRMVFRQVHATKPCVHEFRATKRWSIRPMATRLIILLYLFIPVIGQLGMFLHHHQVLPS